MTNRELKHMKRSELLEMLITQIEENEALRANLAAAQEELDKRQIKIDKAGSIAEAALQLNGLFDAAQEAAKQYLDNIQTLNDRQESICAEMEGQARAQSDAILSEAEACSRQIHGDADAYDAQTRGDADEYSTKTRAEADEYSTMKKAEADEYNRSIHMEADAYWAKVFAKAQALLRDQDSLRSLIMTGGKAEE